MRTINNKQNNYALPKAAPKAAPKVAPTAEPAADPAAEPAPAPTLAAEPAPAASVAPIPAPTLAPASAASASVAQAAPTPTPAPAPTPVAPAAPAAAVAPKAAPEAEPAPKAAPAAKPAAEPPIEAIASFDVDDVSFDGTCVTLEEVYNARNNTIEQKRVQSNANDVVGTGSLKQDKKDDDDSQYKGDGSMSSMSHLFRKARGERHQETSRPSYDYGDDDDATIDSLSDVFPDKKKNNNNNKNTKKPSSSSSAASVSSASQGSGGSSSTNITNNTKNTNIIKLLPKPTTTKTTTSTIDDDDSLAGIIGDVAGLHDQSEVNDDDDDCDGDEENNRFGSTTYDKIVAAGGGGGINIIEKNENEVAASSSNENKKKKQSQGSFISNKLMCGLCFCFIIIAALATVLGFYIYYKNGGNKSLGGLDKLLGGGNANNTDITKTFTGTPTPAPSNLRANGGGGNDNKKDSDSSETIATTTSPPSPSPTKNQQPTVSPTENYIDPLMEFLQDSQVYFDKDPYSSNFMAVQWLADEANSGVSGVSSAYGNGLPALDEKLIQRFALLSLDFALNRPAPPLDDDGVVKMEDDSDVDADADFNHYTKSYTIGVKHLDECDWEGITCNNTMVKEIGFGYSNLTGTIAPEIKLLQDLEILDLSNNDINGPIPESMYNIKGLKELYLYKNQITGSLSNKMSNWWNM
jgi:hypothetical protein